MPFPSHYYSSSLLTLIILCCNTVHAGIQPFDLILEPTDAFVHYNDGFIRAPGFVDLGSLTFTAISEPYSSNDDPLFNDDGDFGEMGDDNIRALDGGVEVDGTVVDIAIFQLPSKCVHSKVGCDWPSLGVGKRSDDGSLRWCCNREAMDLGICEDSPDNYGRLMVDNDYFKLHNATHHHRYVTVPNEGPMSKKIKNGKMEQTQSGTYVVLYANCNLEGREIYVTGEAVWKSKHGYLPGELFGFMFFYLAVTLVYFLLLIWYGSSMYIHEENRIEIEKWIFLAICLGLLEMIFRSGDYFYWNNDGYRSSFIIWVGVLSGVLKQGISRCLLVMVSLGWGVVRDSLGSLMKAIVVLGACFVATSATRDMLIVFALEDINKLTYSEEEDILSTVKILTIVVSIVDVIFIMWILDALNNTMLYLENMSQTRKLERFLKLRCLFLFAILFGVMWAVFTLVDSVNEEGIVEEEHAWAVDAATEINYLFLLVGVAYLWKPNPNAKEYAYVMELPAMGDDDGVTELELSGVVPSAADYDDSYDMKKGDAGFRDDPDDFQIT